MLDNMIPIPDSTFKDDTPLNTVTRIKRILKENGIEAEERWNESGVPHCYSIRIAVVGTTFSVNGKGVTKEFALASGYGELMERLQLGRISNGTHQKTALSLENTHAEYMPLKELLHRSEKWYSLLADKLYQYTGTRLTAEELLMQYADADGNIIATPYYCANRQTLEYLPAALRKSVYSSNGCAAGNTMEEAIVQAISEIIERQFKLHILSEGIPLPDIPDDILKTYKISYDIITYLRSKAFRVVVKNCSLGSKFPVVCVCLIDQNTGRYHTHFGAYPKFEIALQRTLTESFQGRNIDKIANYENFLPKKDDAFELENIMSELVTGTSEKLPSFFVNPLQTTCSSISEFSGTNNQELLRECIEFLSEQGHDILIRDCSALGFPTYQVIVPGYSEVFVHRMVSQHNDLRFMQYAPNVLRNPSTAKIEDIMGFMMNLSQAKKRQLGSSSFLSQANLPAQLSDTKEAYLMNATMAHVHYTLGRYAETIKYIDKMLSAADQTDAEALICIKRYLSLSANRCDSEEILSILNYFHRPETVQALYSCIVEKKNPLDAFTLHCDLNCTSSCLLYSSCRKKQIDELAQMITDRLQALDPAALKVQFEQILK